MKVERFEDLICWQKARFLDIAKGSAGENRNSVT